VETLVDLQRGFLDHQVISYYLTVFMPVRGVEQYALRLHEAYGRVAEAKRRLSGPEKKGVLLTSHDFGKFEIGGFLPSPERPERIVLKWHQAAMEQYLPEALKRRIPSRPEDVVVLDYCPESMYCIDHVFRGNGLPYIDPENELVVPAERAPAAARGPLAPTVL
jgi:lysine 2,3-aminomutase